MLERAGGNPLYAEEFVRLLADRDLGAGEMALPESLQALIAARLDTLSPERKSLLQDAAVLGKLFWVGALAEIGGRDAGRARARAARASPQGARPPCAGELDGGRERVLVLASARARRRLRPDPAGRSGRAGTARQPPGSSARQASGSRTWPSCSPTTTCRRSSSPRPPATRSRQESSPGRLGASSHSPGSGRSASTPPRRSRGSPARSSSARPTIRSGRSCSSAGRTPPTRPGARARPRRRSSRRCGRLRARGEGRAKRAR